jgi:hypothetical protein
MSLYCFFYFTKVLIRVHFTNGNFALGLHSGVDVNACLFWSCMDVIVVRVKVSRGIVPSPQLGSTLWTLVNRPMGRFAWTNYIYFKITQFGSSTVTPLYQ